MTTWKRRLRRTQRLLQISIDFRNRMTEIRALRNAVRIEETTPRGQEPIHPAIVAPPASELRVQPADLGTAGLRRPDIVRRLSECLQSTLELGLFSLQPLAEDILHQFAERKQLIDRHRFPLSFPFTLHDACPRS